MASGSVTSTADKTGCSEALDVDRDFRRTADPGTTGICSCCSLSDVSEPIAPGPTTYSREALDRHDMSLLGYCGDVDAVHSRPIDASLLTGGPA